MEIEKQDFCFGDYECYRCGHKLVWENDFMASDTGMIQEDTPIEKDFMMVAMSCPNCGLHYEVYDTNPEDKGDYPYWN